MTLTFLIGFKIVMKLNFLVELTFAGMGKRRRRKERDREMTDKTKAN